MPLRKKNTTRNRIIIAVIVIAVIGLMLISFAPVQHVTEIVLYP